MEQRAELYAKEKHGLQKRKISGEPYVNHPIRVRDIVKEFTQDEIVLCAALLHDVLEDTDTTYDDIMEEFGCGVANMVSCLTSDKPMCLMSSECLLVKLADRLDNVGDLSDSEWSLGYAKQTQYILQKLDSSQLQPNHKELVKRIEEKITPFV